MYEYGMPVTDHSGHGFYLNDEVEVVRPRFITHHIGDRAKVVGFTPRYVLGLMGDGIEMYYVPDEIKVVADDELD